jgi:hypothetical protein
VAHQNFWRRGEALVLSALEHGGAKRVTPGEDPANDAHVLSFEDDGVRFDPATRFDRAQSIKAP